MQIHLDQLPHLSHQIPGTPYRWEMFKHIPHAEGWVVLGWEEYPHKDDLTCVESYEFGEDLQAALVKFTEVHQRIPKQQ